MGKLPDLTPIFYLAMFGLVCAVIGGGTLLLWGGYHLIAALTLYIGS